MTRLLLVRHGETEGNRDHLYRGRWDLPLNETGLAQVEQAGRALGGIALQAIYTSPLLRTQQTAAAVARYQQVAVAKEPGLIDIDFGDWTRKAAADIARSQPQLYQRWHQQPAAFVFPAGEGLAAVRARVEECLARLVEKHPDQQIALVGHRVSIKMLLLVALGLENSAFFRLRIDPASISVLDSAAEHFHLVLSNETCHLQSWADKLSIDDF